MYDVNLNRRAWSGWQSVASSGYQISSSASSTPALWHNDNRSRFHVLFIAVGRPISIASCLLDQSEESDGGWAANERARPGGQEADLEQIEEVISQIVANRTILHYAAFLSILLNIMNMNI